ncbi:hypothetical protein [Catenuloplanes indicus]|uniref:Uncharacterized protein n=1 Tax=Catenuloplanes indicus TaxID=137267 RepID=A0AAE3VYJ4_9ACTN|nr:hypothetical protein [Catenuloplanes indicus]MDQ0366368.1 hypothetical protein [Catenuloplanes indicus]
MDLRPGADVDAALDVLRADGPDVLYARVVPLDGGWHRLELTTGDAGPALGRSVVALLASAEHAVRAFVALDHDADGAEQVVLDGRSGTVTRVHQVRIHPFGAGFGFRPGSGSGEPPVLPEVPAGVAPGRFPGRGQILNGPQSIAALAGLYDVPPADLKRARRRTRRPAGLLGAPGGPFQPWLDALRIPWTAATGDRPIKLRPGPVWREAVVRYALPSLPGRWLVFDEELVAEPVGLIARAIVQGQAVLHPLYLPPGHPGWRVHDALDLRLPRTTLATRETAEPAMQHLAEAIRSRALPHFAAYGTLSGYVEHCRAVSSDPYRLHAQALTEIVLERFDDALTSLDAITSMVVPRLYDRTRPAGLGPARLTDLAAEADHWRRRLAEDPFGAQSDLLANVPTQRRHLGLPA